MKAVRTTTSDMTPAEIVAAFLDGAHYARLHGIGELGSTKGRQHWTLTKKWPAPRQYVEAPMTPKSFANPHHKASPRLVQICGVWVQRRWYVALRKLPGLEVSPSTCGNWLRLKFDGGVGVLLGIDRGNL